MILQFKIKKFKINYFKNFILKLQNNQMFTNKFSNKKNKIYKKLLMKLDNLMIIKNSKILGKIVKITY